METFIERGNAPHYTEIAKHLGVNPDQGKEALYDLINTGVTPMWLHPGTDLIASVAPFEVARGSDQQHIETGLKRRYLTIEHKERNAGHKA